MKEERNKAFFKKKKMSKNREREPSSDREYRWLAELCNVAGWTGLNLNILGIFVLISNNFQVEGVRIASTLVGCFVSLLFAFLTLYAHAHLLRNRTITLFAAMAVGNLIPAMFWLIVFFASEEYKVAQNKV